MGDLLNMYVVLGILIGLVFFYFLFRKWNLPAYCKKRFLLNTKLKAIIFALVVGVVLALLLAMVMDMLQIAATWSQLLEGFAIGFNCSLLIGIAGPSGSSGGHSGGSNTKNSKQNSDNKGRRSKG